MNDISKKDAIVQKMFQMEYCPVQPNEIPKLDEYTKIPLTELSAFDDVFTAIASAFQTTPQSAKTAVSMLFRIKLPDAALDMITEKSQNVFETIIGTAPKQKNNRDADKPDSITKAALSPFDPMVIFMAIALASIERKLDAIQETQIEILAFLKEEKKSDLRGSVTFLADVFNKYKFNWNNEMYISGMYVKVQDIKHQAVQNIDFYRNAIRKQIKNKGIIFANQIVKDKIQKVHDEFKNYQLAVYLYGFASFVEILLLKNFDAEYLNHVSQSIREYSYQYLELYTECFNRLEADVQSSLQKHMVDGLATFSGAAGEAISKIPMISKSQIDKNLVKSGKTLSRLSESNAENMLSLLTDCKKSNVQPFLESIHVINRLYHEPIDMLFDAEHLYIRN